MNITEAKRDTAIFGSRQWVVELGGTSFFFSSEDDAKSAIRLSWSAEAMAGEELADEIRKVLWRFDELRSLR